MRSQLPEHTVVALLRQCFLTPRCQSSRQTLRTIRRSRILPRRTRSILEEQQRHYQTQSRDVGNDRHPAPSNLNLHTHQSDLEQNKNQAPEKDGVTRIAVLGSGITGLASAHYLARELPHAKITIYEGSDRVGGWLQTEQFGEQDAKVHIEQGPRTLRPASMNAPAGLTTLELIQDLGLEDELIITPRDSAAAKNRFVYYPDRLNLMPGPGQSPFSIIYSVFTNPIYEGLIEGLGGELGRPRRRMDLDDESVGSFLNRRLEGFKVADNVASAVLHGIYAGDIYKLSIKSLLPTFWYIEGLYNTLVGGMAALMMGRKFLITHQDMQLSSTLGIKINPHLLYKMRNASVYTFKAGISTLSAMLEDRLKANPNVDFKLNSKISSIEHDVQSDQILIKTSPELPTASYTRAISTIPGRTLSTLTTIPLPSLASIHSVTVMVVNLFFPQPSLLPQRGFGYLIPRSIPFQQNPERALGVIFDTDATPGQDSIPGTKVTVMLGGHWWDDFESYPTAEEGVQMARRVLKRHLGVDAEPIVSKATLQKDCIPQYTVGHEARMKRADGELQNAFGGKLAVAGNSYTGVGVNDCVRAARDVVMELKKGDDVTGLEGFARPKAWVMVSRDVPR